MILKYSKNTRTIGGVFTSGRWISRKQIDQMMADLAAKNEQNKDKYDWKKRKDL